MKHLRKFDSVSDMETALASATIDILALAYNNGTPVAKIKEVEPTPPGPDPTIPFYIEDISGSENTVQIMKNDDGAPTLTIEKSTDGETWESMGSTSTTAIEATIPANGKLYLRCNTSAWGTANYFNKINTTANCNVGGNIMSLLYGSSFTGNETSFPSESSHTFRLLFVNNGRIVSAYDLLLPAATLVNYCYASMFNGCTALTTTPTTLPATTLADDCYNSMFRGCSALTTIPSLPATTLANNCYSSMFYGCTSLTTAPTLPVTTLVNGCYWQMFYGCTSLTTAPDLPATTLVPGCYQWMFRGCSHLNYIKCLATDISATQCTYGWVQNVAATGTFVKDPNMSDWETGNNGIPSGWTVEDAA